jgi:Isocitrate dehydrogenases
MTCVWNRDQTGQLFRQCATDSQRDFVRDSKRRKSVTLVHKGNIMKFTEGAFRDWGFEIAKKYFGAEEFDGGPWCRIRWETGCGNRDQGRDCRHHAPAGVDAAGRFRRYRHAKFEWRLPERRARRASGRNRHRPGGNINYITGHAVFEATHGTAPKYANLDKVNPGSVILSGEMMFRYMGWTEAADLILRIERRDRKQTRHV